MLLPALAAAKRKAQKINCVNNLKQVGLAFRIWEGDNGDKFPMAVPINGGGALENVGSRGNTATPANYGVQYVFQVMSNELSTTKVVYCPSDDRSMQPTPNFTTLAAANISYFVSGDASDSFPQMIISGDRNLGTATTAGMAASDYIKAAVPQKWDVGTIWAWTAGNLHLKSGNLGLTDGSVQTATIAIAQTTFNNATNGFVPPIYYNFPN
jgi:hypothetical protein